MNHAGEIRTLVGIAEPDVRVWTTSATRTSVTSDRATRVAAAKAEILEGATPATVVVANADDPLVMTHVGGVSAGAS